jgi:hypothetical protein
MIRPRIEPRAFRSDGLSLTGSFTWFARGADGIVCARGGWHSRPSSQTGVIFPYFLQAKGVDLTKLLRTPEHPKAGITSVSRQAR